LLLQAPLYIVAQLMGSILASGTLALVFDVTPNAYFGTVPVGSNGQSLVLEIVISFLLMFVISGVGTDDRAAVCTPNTPNICNFTLFFHT
jgi:aquaporin NIP